MGKTYKIECIGDLLELDGEALGRLLDEFARAVWGAKLTYEAAKSAGSRYSGREALPCLKWTDDGEQDVTVMLNGEELFSVKNLRE